MRVLVKDVMTRTVIKLQRDWTIKKVVQIFLERVIDGAPVVDEQGKLIGIFTKTHLLRAMDKSPDTPVESLMNKNVIPINENMPVEEALSIPVGRLPVVNEHGVMVGWLTRTDLANAFLDQYQAAIVGLEAILDSVFNPIIAVDRGGVIIAFNKAAANLFGVDGEETIGVKSWEFLKEDWGFLEVITTGNPNLGCQRTVKGRKVEVNLTPLIQNGSVIGAVATIQMAST